MPRSLEIGIRCRPAAFVKRGTRSREVQIGSVLNEMCFAASARDAAFSDGLLTSGIRSIARTATTRGAGWAHKLNGRRAVPHREALYLTLTDD